MHIARNFRCRWGITANCWSLLSSQKRIGGLPCKQKIGVNKFWVRESEIGEECWQVWAWILCVNFLVGLKPWKNKAERFAFRIRYQNSLRISPALFPKFARPKQKIHPKSALQNLGIKFNCGSQSIFNFEVIKASVWIKRRLTGGGGKPGRFPFVGKVPDEVPNPFGISWWVHLIGRERGAARRGTYHGKINRNGQIGTDKSKSWENADLLKSEEDKRATTNVQNGLVFFFLFSFILFYYLFRLFEPKQ